MKQQKISNWVVQLLAAMMVFSFFFGITSAYAQEAATTSSGITAITSFADLPRSHEQYTPIAYLSQIGVLNGYPDGTFKPDNPINRAEVLKVILAGSSVEIPSEVTDAPFLDVDPKQWFARFVRKAKELGIVKGDDNGGFAPARQVNKAEFIKMLLLANNVNTEAIKGVEGGFADVPDGAWFASFLNYSAHLGLVSPDSDGNLSPNHLMTRGEVAEALYLLKIIQQGSNTQFLLSRAEAEMAQIEVYVAANRVDLAKKASELAVDLTQQAYKNLPTNNVVLGAAKLARSYDWLVDSFVLGISKNFEQAATKANDAINKATEAWEVNNATQPIAKHIKDRAREILTQVGGTED